MGPSRCHPGAGVWAGGSEVDWKNRPVGLGVWMNYRFARNVPVSCLKQQRAESRRPVSARHDSAQGRVTHPTPGKEQQINMKTERFTRYGRERRSKPVARRQDWMPG